MVGEMIAGVILGPTVLGSIWPDALGSIFTKDSRSILEAGAQLGVGLYMFLVGLEFQVSHISTKARSALSVSLAGILAPFALSFAIAPLLLHVGGLFSESCTYVQAASFMGAAVSITAFPMLARIISERGLSGTSLGTLSLAAGAIDDAIAWCILAVVIAIFSTPPPFYILGATIAPQYVAIIGAILYFSLVLTLGRMSLKPLGRIAASRGSVTNKMLAVVLMMFCLAAWYTDIIGLHAVFGGFLLGVAMPRGALAIGLKERLEGFTVVFLLPMFFTFSGLKTQLNVLFEPRYAVASAIILVVSFAGKGLACWMAARLTGEDNKTALGVASLMNSRGLMELILINIALKAGLIEKPLFSILVLMAIVTTLLATPFFEFTSRNRVPG